MDKKVILCAELQEVREYTILFPKHIKFMRRLQTALYSMIHSMSAITLLCIRQKHRRISPAMTLVELLIVVAMVGTLAAIGVPAYNSYIDKTKNHQAIEDIRFIAAALKLYSTEHGTFPETLDQVPSTQLLDPWDHPYGYYKIQGKSWEGEVKTHCRHNGNEKPLNNDFDLYSMGKNGKSKRNLTGMPSRDDIIRIYDGAYVGLASEY